MNPKGAARIKFGQYTAWQVGLHGYSNPHESLVQVEEVAVHRDYNRDLKRTGDLVEWGLFGINQHWGFDHPGKRHSYCFGRLSGRPALGRTR
jgi:hypothetical protein